MGEGCPLTLFLLVCYDTMTRRPGPLVLRDTEGERPSFLFCTLIILSLESLFAQLRSVLFASHTSTSQFPQEVAPSCPLFLPFFISIRKYIEISLTFAGFYGTFISMKELYSPKGNDMKKRLIALVFVLVCFAALFMVGCADISDDQPTSTYSITSPIPHHRSCGYVRHRVTVIQRGYSRGRLTTRTSTGYKRVYTCINY